MKKSLIIMFSLIFSTISLSAIASENHKLLLNPSVLMILDAGIQSDSLYAERMISLDIKDELTNYKPMSENLLIIHGQSKIAMNKTKELEFSNYSDITGLISEAD